MINQAKELHKRFLNELKQRIPERGKLANFLMEVLLIEKEAIYRRLRSEVPFTFTEIVAIAKKLHISIDNIFDITPSLRSYSFRLYGYNFFNMTDVDYMISGQLVSTVKEAASSPHSEFGFAASIIPLHFSTYYRHIFRLYMLKWMYQFGSPGSVLPYAKIDVSEKLKELHLQYLQEIQNIKYTYFVWDGLLIFYLTNDIRYFSSIRLISDEEVVLLKEEIAKFLNDLEQLTRVGAYETGNRVEVYVSNLNFESTYSYLTSNNLTLAMISTFTLSSATSVEAEACENMKTWIQSLKRSSTLISECSEMDRRMFFRKQREYLDRI